MYVGLGFQGTLVCTLVIWQHCTPVHVHVCCWTNWIVHWGLAWNEELASGCVCWNMQCTSLAVAVHLQGTPSNTKVGVDGNVPNESYTVRHGKTRCTGAKYPGVRWSISIHLLFWILYFEVDLVASHVSLFLWRVGECPSMFFQIASVASGGGGRES
jgi:hypothetical protein